jgi:hypothetical protein
MQDTTRALILSHWNLANERKWDQFATLLHPDLNYEVPQTREYIDSAEGYLEMFRTWPGDWRATIQHLVCEEGKAVSVIDFKVSAEVMTGITVFGLAQGKIVAVTDYWPDPYEPPARATAFLKRRPREA